MRPSSSQARQLNARADTLKCGAQPVGSIRIFRRLTASEPLWVPRLGARPCVVMGGW